MPQNTFEFIGVEDWCRKAESQEKFINSLKTFLPLFSNEDISIPYINNPYLSENYKNLLYESDSIITGLKFSELSEPFHIGGSSVAHLGPTMIKDSSLLVLVNKNLALTEGYGDERWAYYQLNKWPNEHNFPLSEIGVDGSIRRFKQNVKIYTINTKVRHIPIPGIYLTVRPHDQNIYHWVFETLVRLRCLEVVPALRNIPIIVHAPLNEFQLKTLELFGVNNKIIVTNGESFTIDELFFPSIPAPPTLHTASMRWLRNNFLKGLPSSSNPKRRRLYISRQDSTRRVKNEHEIFAILKLMDFEMLLMSKLSPQNQMEAFRDAEIIVLPHGAAGTHLLLAPLDCRVIELHSPTFIENCYASLCYSLGLNYHWLIGEKCIEQGDKVSDYYRDYLIDAKLLKKIIENNLFK